MTASAHYSKAYRERKKAEGFRILHGYPTKAPHVNRPPSEIPPHGPSRYRSRIWRCRCDTCRASVAEINRRYTRKRTR